MAHLTKSEILERLNIKPAELARMLGITRQSVQTWADDQPIPLARELMLTHVIHPERFTEQEKSAPVRHEEAA